MYFYQQELLILIRSNLSILFFFYWLVCISLSILAYPKVRKIFSRVRGGGGTFELGVRQAAFEKPAGWLCWGEVSQAFQKVGQESESQSHHCGGQVPAAERRGKGWEQESSPH